MTIQIVLEGIDENIARLDAIDHGLLLEVEKVLYTRAELIMARSKNEFVPVDLGVLKDSGYVQRPVRRGLDIEVTLGFGGAAQAYAMRQHEDLELHHPPLKSRKGHIGSQVGGPKYLERPMTEEEDHVYEALESAIDALIETAR